MRYRNISTSHVLAGLLLVASGCASGDNSAQIEGSTTSSKVAAKVVAPDVVGPYKVGRRTLTTTDVDRKRELTVDVWYPVAAEATGKPSRYSFLPTAYVDSKIALDSPPPSTDGPFPLVVYSHGSGGVRYVASYFTELLASHGFVVYSADHTGDTATDRIVGSDTTPELNAFNRATDLPHVIDFALSENDRQDSPLAGIVDPERIGTAGHSFGGFTAIAAATGFANGEGTVEPDKRIKAVALMAPYTELIDDATLGKLDVPSMIVTGTLDDTTPIAPETERPFSLASGTPRYKVDLIGGGHQSFTDVCMYTEELPKLPDVPQIVIDTINGQAVNGCAPELLDIDTAQRVSNTFLISFLETELAGTTGYETVLTDEGASAVGDSTLTAVR